MKIAPEKYYADRLTELRHQLVLQKKTQSLYGWMRFAVIAAGIIGVWQLSGTSILITIIIAATALTGFLLLLSKDISNNRRIHITENLILINQEEVESLEHRYLQFPEGKEFLQNNHPYATDLDITGHASLFQYICRACSEAGQATIAQWLSTAANKETILLRQEAVKELCQQPAWRQQLRAAGLDKKISTSLSEKINNWISQPVQFINNPFWKYIRLLLPAIALSALLLNITSYLPDQYFYPIILTQAALAFAITKKTLPAQKGLGRITEELQSLQYTLSCIEDKEMQSPLLQSIRSKVRSGHESSASSIRQLKKIMDRIDYRLNPLIYLPLNIFLCWDLQQVWHLEKWRKKQQAGISGWFESLAEAEALSSFANLAFNHPNWTYPVISAEHGRFTASQLGHPLIPQQRMVTSDFSTQSTGHINVITGSNMAGKSTFLRSTGINIVLALAGAPVYATAMEVSVMKVMSSMRISDNLEENTSTFYAELKKLRDIIEAVQRKEPVFLLLDEILRGTNSADRQAGSQALIRQLLADNAVGMIATHDLALTKMAEEFPDRLTNYHFDVQVNGEELWFDYKLKTGICTSMNASLLMKKIGIRM